MLKAIWNKTETFEWEIPFSNPLNVILKESPYYFFIRSVSCDFSLNNTKHACRVTVVVGRRNCVYMSVYIWYMACVVVSVLQRRQWSWWSSLPTTGWSHTTASGKWLINAIMFSFYTNNNKMYLSFYGQPSSLTCDSSFEFKQVSIHFIKTSHSRSVLCG